MTAWRHRTAGFAILMVVFMAAVVALALTVAVPVVLTEGRREREEELIFRGEQYQRAIGLFHRKFNRFPLKVEELLHTNDRSFLRSEWPDPMTKDGEWRLIRVGPGGQLVGSVQEQPAADPLGRGGSQQTRSPAGGLSSSIETLPLIGVASRSTAASIRVYNGEETYDAWEFIYNPSQAVVPQGTVQPQEGGDKNSPNGGQQRPQGQPQRPPRN